MESSDDRELRRMLREWEAPAAPPGLRSRVMRRRSSPWRWLLTGTIRLPVPVGVAAAVAAVAWLALGGADAELPGTRPATVSLGDFQPVAQLEPVVWRGQP